MDGGCAICAASHSLDCICDSLFKESEDALDEDEPFPSVY